MKRDVGRLGEKALDTWATQAGITINKAFEDKRGWDYILEFPLSTNLLPSEYISLDKIGAPLKCWVQVKSTDGTPGHWSIKLDNWAHLVFDSYPAFFLVCEFDNNIECQRAYLVHIGEKQIRNTLKRLRKIKPNQHTRLHKKTLSFTYGPEDELLSLNGAGLIQKIRQYVPDSLEAYSKQKKALLDTVGYEEGGYEVKLSFKIPSTQESDAVEHLVNFALGLHPYLETERVEIKNRRFGIEKIEASLSNGRLELRDRDDHAKPATVLIYSEDRSREVRIESNLHAPTALGYKLASQHPKLRFEAPFIELVTLIGPKTKGTIKFTFPDLEEQHKLKDLQQLASLILMIDHAIRQNLQLEFEIRFDSSNLGKGFLLVDSQKDFCNNFRIDIAEAIDCAWRIAKHFDINHDVEANTFDFLQQGVALSVVANALDRIPNYFKISYKSDELPQNDEGLLCMPVVYNVLLGKYRPIISFVIIGHPQRVNSPDENGAPLEVISTDIRISGKRLLEQDEDASSIIKEMFRQAVNEYKDKMQILITPDILKELGEIL